MMKYLAAAALLLSATALTAPADAAMYGSSAPTSSGHMMGNPRPMAAPWKRIHTSKGWIWADSRGFALYTFDKDPRGQSTCYGACAVAWPPFYAPMMAMGGQAMGKWSVVDRFMFAKQWAYNGKPLYFWMKDTRPGQVTGDGINGFHVAR